MADHVREGVAFRLARRARSLLHGLLRALGRPFGPLEEQGLDLRKALQGFLD